MKTYRQVLQEGKETLRQANLPEGDWDAWLLFSRAFGLDRKEYLLRGGEPAEEAGQRVFEEYLRQRLDRRPTAYILGSWGFMDLEFLVDERVLVPRQDTETLVEEALHRLQGRTGLQLLDLCTGSGCIAVSLAHHLGTAARVWGTDISPEALTLARENARRSGVQVSFCQGDLFRALPPELAGTFDMILSNPPYISPEEYAALEPEVREYEPTLALRADRDGMAFYERIAAEAAGWLKEGGALGLEIGCSQAERTAALLREAGFDNIMVIKDLNGLDRTVWAEKGKR